MMWGRLSLAESELAEHLADERSRAIRLLLFRPLLDVGADPDGFRLVARHHGWLAEWFETACGWALAVDIAGGFARLSKRSARVDARRPLRRTRGTAAPYDRRRYQLLCLACAELVRHPVTTIGLLAGAVAGEAGLDTSRHRERAAFVDALKTIIDWGALEAVGGDIEAFVESEGGNAILTADTAQLHRLLASPQAPSALDAGLDIAAATDALLAEPRYGEAATLATGDGGAAADRVDDDQRNRWARHSLARRLLDDPAVHYEDLSAEELAYLSTPAGRRWLRDRVAEAGFELEERAEGLVAIDTDALATDKLFPAPHGNAHQLALLLIDRLVSTGVGGERQLCALSPDALEAEVTAVFERFPGWARGRRDDHGPAQLASEAVDLLVAFDLATVDADGTVRARPAMARYRAGEPRESRAEPSLFDEAVLEGAP